MNIFYSPSYSGYIFKGIEGSTPSDVLMDTKIVGTSGLLGHIEERMGLRTRDISPALRLSTYFAAMKRHVFDNPESVLAKSFATSEMGTAKEVLSWRDELVMDGYDFSKPAVSPRLEAINDIERHFQELMAEPGLADRTWNAIKWLEGTDSIRFDDMVIITTVDVELMPPTIRRLLSALEDRGAQLARKNFEREGFCPYTILHFSDKREADEYVAFHSHEIGGELWIAADNKAHDNWMNALGGTPMGSCSTVLASQIKQIMLQCISLLREPLDIQNLLDLLYSPFEIIPNKLRWRLAHAIAKTGGYRNAECEKVINDYIGTGFESEEASGDTDIDPRQAEKERDKRMADVERFLPSVRRSETDADPKRVDAERLSSIVRSVADIALKALNGPNPALRSLPWNTLTDMAATILTAIATETDESIEWSKVDSWTSSLLAPETQTQYPAFKDSTTLINDPVKMIAHSMKTIWLDAVGEIQAKQDCQFLMPSERQALACDMTFWEPELETRYNFDCMTMPLKLSEEVVFVTYDRIGSTPVPPHPIMLHLEQMAKQSGMDMADVTSNPKTEPELMSKVLPIDNSGGGYYVELKDPKAVIKWPDKLSYTSLSDIIFHPLDYVMQTMAGIRPSGPAELPNEHIAKGNVAHAVIAKLCEPRDGDEETTADQIEERMRKEFKELFPITLEEHGASLNRSDNRLEVKLLEEQLEKSIANLANIIRANHLVVTACERPVETSLALLDEESDESDICGTVDMVLRDTRDGSTVVLDFKWARSLKPYRRMLHDNVAIQLELYKQILANVDHKHISRTGYFVMPMAKVLSLDEFVGPDCERVTATSDASVIHQIVNSFHYRFKEISGGKIEMGEEKEADGLDYFTDTTDLNLLPLPLMKKSKKDDPDLKDGNRFSDFNMFRE